VCTSKYVEACHCNGLFQGCGKYVADITDTKTSGAAGQASLQLQISKAPGAAGEGCHCKVLVQWCGNRKQRGRHEGHKKPQAQLGRPLPLQVSKASGAAWSTRMQADPCKDGAAVQAYRRCYFELAASRCCKVLGAADTAAHAMITLSIVRSCASASRSVLLFVG
jgi:hypothetical protein